MPDEFAINHHAIERELSAADELFEQKRLLRTRRKAPEDDVNIVVTVETKCRLAASTCRRLGDERKSNILGKPVRSRRVIDERMPCAGHSRLN